MKNQMAEVEQLLQSAEADPKLRTALAQDPQQTLTAHGIEVPNDLEVLKILPSLGGENPIADSPSYFGCKACNWGLAAAAVAIVAAMNLIPGVGEAADVGAVAEAAAEAEGVTVAEWIAANCAQVISLFEAVGISEGTAVWIIRTMGVLSVSNLLQLMCGPGCFDACKS